MGKSTAYAGAETFIGTSAFGVGTGGHINLTGSSIYIQSINAETTHSLNTLQTNNLNENDVNIDAIHGQGNISQP